MSDERRLRPEHVRALRLGHGANCSSVGSVIDTLFLGAIAGSVVFAAVCAALEEENENAQAQAEAQAQASDHHASEEREE